MTVPLFDSSQLEAQKELVDSLASEFEKLARRFDRFSTSDPTIGEPLHDLDLVRPVQCANLLFKALEAGLFASSPQPWDLRSVRLHERHVVQLEELRQSYAKLKADIAAPPTALKIAEPEGDPHEPLLTRLIRMASAAEPSPVDVERISDEVDNQISQIDQLIREATPDPSEPDQVKFADMFRAMSWMLFLRCELVWRYLDRFRVDWPAVTRQSDLAATLRPELREYLDGRTPPNANWRVPGGTIEVRRTARVRLSAETQSTACELLVELLSASSGTRPLRKRAKRKQANKSPKNQDVPTFEKLASALTKHHKYSNGHCGNEIPIGVRELALLAQVSNGRASEFFKEKFNDGQPYGHEEYKRRCADPDSLILAMRLLNQEVTPSILRRGLQMDPSDDSDSESPDDR